MITRTPADCFLTNDEILQKFKSGITEFDSFTLSNVTVESEVFQGCIFRNCVFINVIFQECSFDTITWQNCVFSDTNWVLCSFKDELFIFGNNVLSVELLMAFSRLISDRLVDPNSQIKVESPESDPNTPETPESDPNDPMEPNTTPNYPKAPYSPAPYDPWDYSAPDNTPKEPISPWDDPDLDMPF